MGRILALDYGKKRVGIAVSDPLRIIASPMVTVSSKDILAWLEEYFATNHVDIVVIGMPLQMDGSPSDSQRYIRPFMSRFRARFPAIDLCEADERFTSVLAHRAMIEGGVPRLKRQGKEIVDRTAASIILQGFLETIK
ncbi:MAG: Holliday junction resolvase RuvX [Mucinivorans sp.]